MATIRKIQLGLGLALVALGGFAVGCAGVGGDEGSAGEATLAFDPMPDLPPGAIAICTVSGPTFSGRQWAALMPTRHGRFVSRFRIGGEAPTFFRSCHEIAHELGLEPID